MPSWNVHTAHMERLLHDWPAYELGIADVDAFAFGNVAPDIYVGYMVAHTTRVIEYGETHLAAPGFMPAPAADEFWRRYVGAAPAEHQDMVLGAWAHLVCDAFYNTCARRVATAAGYVQGERARILKQGDFDLFGRSLHISFVPKVTPELLAQAAAFPQYAIAEADVYASVEVLADIVRNNQLHPAPPHPDYQMLSEEFFSTTFERANAAIARRLRSFVHGGPLEPLTI